MYTIIKREDSSRPIDIPAEIATCPYCDSLLYVEEVTGWVEDGAFWKADEISVECESEPDDGGSKDWDAEDDIELQAWITQHSDMPYVYWLPMTERVKKWLAENYRWDFGEAA